MCSKVNYEFFEACIGGTRKYMSEVLEKCFTGGDDEPCTNYQLQISSERLTDEIYHVSD